MDETGKTDREIFDVVVAIEDFDRRAETLAKECSGNPEQLARVQALLDALDEADGFMETPIYESATTRDPGPTPIIGNGERPGSTIGNYKLLQEIGAGGFGVVYMAEQQQPVKRKVALKIIKPGMDTREVIARFEAERQALALMSHPNIAQVFDGGTTASGRPYFVMELVKGIPITQFCDKSKLSTKRRLNLFLDICSAIQHAHQKGVIHRDIKPSNVLVTLHDGVPVPKVIDFGIAKALNQELTEKSLFTAYGQMIGTPQYTSPEQAEMSGLDIDTRSDIYSLGILLYELLTGETPISRKEVKKAGLHEVQRLIKEKEPTKPSLALSIMCRESTTVADYRREDPSRLIEQIEGDLDWIVLKALEKDRSRRYESAGGFANDIRNYLDYRPVTASPPTVAYLIGKFVQRHTRLIGALAAVFAALLVGAVGMTVLYLGAQSARRTAEEQSAAATRERRKAEAAQELAESARAAETEQRQLAQDTAQKLKTTLSRADFVAGVAHLEQDETQRGLAYLARSLRTDPEFKPAAQRLVAALRDRNLELQPEMKLEHDAPISDFDLSRSGDFLLTLATDNTARMWDAHSLELRQEWGTDDPLVSAAFIRGSDHVVVLTKSGIGRVWDLGQMKPTGPPIVSAGHITRIKGTIRSDGHAVVATISGKHRLQVWNGTTGKPITNPLEVEDLHAVDCFLKQDGSRVLGQFGPHQFRYYDLSTGQQIGPGNTIGFARYPVLSMRRETLSVIDRGLWKMVGNDLVSGFKRMEDLREGGNVAVITEPLVNPDENLLITVIRPMTKRNGRRMPIPNSDAVIRVLDPLQGTLVAHVTETNATHNPVIHSASGISALQVDDFSARIRDLKSTAILGLARTSAAIAAAERGRPNIVFSPSGDRFAVRLADAGLQIHRTLDARLVVTVGRRRMPFHRLQFSPEGQRIATTTRDGGLQVWNANTGQPMTARLQHTMEVGKILFGSRGRRVFSLDAGAAGSGHGIIRCWEARETAARNSRLPFPPLSKKPVMIAASDWLAVETYDGDILVVSEQVDGSARQLHQPGKHLRLAGMGDDGEVIAAVHRNEAVVWDLSNFGQPINLPHGNAVATAEFSPDGSRLLTLTANQRAQVWNVRRGEAVTDSVPLGGPIVNATFRPDSAQIAISMAKGILIWDFNQQDPAKSVRRIAAGRQPFGRIEYSPDGQTLLTTSLNDVAIIDTESGEARHTFTHSFALSSATFSPSGTEVLATGPASGQAIPGVAVVWDIASGKRVAELAHESPVAEAVFAGERPLIVTRDITGALRIWHPGTEQTLASPIQLEPGVDFDFVINRSGTRLYTVAQGKIRQWPMPVDHESIPAWLGPLAEAVAGSRLDDSGDLEMIAPDSLQSWQQQLKDLKGTNALARFARWFAADRSTRTLAPDSSTDRAGLVEQLIQENEESALRAALSLDPTNASVYTRLVSLVPAEQPFLARPWRSFPEWYAGQANRFGPDLAEGWLTRADILERRGKFDQCLAALTRRHELSAPSVDSDFLMALALRGKGNLDGAYEHFRPHLEKLIAGGAKGQESSLRLLEKQLPVDPDATQLGTLASRLARATNNIRLSRALADWISRKSIELAPDDKTVRALRADLLNQQGRPDAARQLASQLIANDPDDPIAWFTMAKLQYREGEWSEALKSIDRSLALRPERRSKTRRQLRVKVLAATGDHKATREAFIAMELLPRHDRVGAAQIDLSAHYNILLNESWFGATWAGQKIAFSAYGQQRTRYTGSFNPGPRRMDGVLFDIRGGIHLDGDRWAHLDRTRNPTAPQGFPPKVENIKVRGKWKSLHFIHGLASVAEASKVGTELVGSYWVHYTDGQKREIPIRKGRDILPILRTEGNQQTVTHATLAWSQRIPDDGPLWRFFHSIWTNPLPHVEISHLDFTAKAQPVLLALTGQ